MVIMVDDLLTLPFALGGIELLPNYFTTIFTSIHKHALEETYPLDKINDAIKENRMLYEFSELTKEEYEKKKKSLMERLEIAKKVREMNLSSSMNVLGGWG